jgi:hypothetical protein
LVFFFNPFYFNFDMLSKTANKRRNRRRPRSKTNSALSDAFGPVQGLFPRTDLTFRPRTNVVPDKIPRNLRDAYHWFRRSTSTFGAGTSSITGSTSADVETNYSFLLSDLVSYTEFTTLFDQYCIVAVELMFLPTVNVVDNGTSTDLGRLITAIDHDSSANITQAGIRQYISVSISEGYVAQTRIVYPRIDNAVLNSSSALTSLGNIRMWIDCAYPAVSHYGIRTVLTQASVSAAVYRVEAEYIVCFRETI